MNETKEQHDDHSAPPVGLAAGAIAVVLIVVMILGVGWVVMRVAEAPEAPEGVAYDLRGDSDVAETPEDVLEVARVFIKDQKFGAADKLLENAVVMWPTHQGLRHLYSEMLLTLERPVESYAQEELALSIGPDHAEYRHRAGTIAASIGLLDDAEAHYAMAQTLDPRSAKHPLYLAQVQRKLGKIDAAKKNLVIAGKLDPDLAITWGSLAGIALDQNRLLPASTYIKKARGLEPGSALWRLVDARITRRMNNPSAALELLLAIERENILSDPDLLNEIALCYGLLGEPGSAAQWYVEAANRSADDSELVFKAAEWLERSGQAERAITYAHSASMLGHEPARALLTRLEEAADN
ncbi:hypothetical protein JYT11_01015 [Planctomycetaceae bacterium AH-315-I19]|nr:hypothetical protein [Planctomycetaceae bacterium AH-315-I19]